MLQAAPQGCRVANAAVATLVSGDGNLGRRPVSRISHNGQKRGIDAAAEQDVEPAIRSSPRIRYYLDAIRVVASASGHTSKVWGRVTQNREAEIKYRKRKLFLIEVP
jgi:hypothetical protein